MLTTEKMAMTELTHLWEGLKPYTEDADPKHWLTQNGA